MKQWTLASLKPVVEAIIFASQGPVTMSHLRQALPDAPLELIRQVIKTIERECRQEHRGIELVSVAKGYRFQTKSIYQRWVVKSVKRAGHRLSRAALETLAVIAYRQPVTRAEIEKIRGVDSSGTIKYLMAKKLIRISGRKDLPGRPLLYSTTNYFLEVFQLSSINDLPGIHEMDSAFDNARQIGLFDKKAIS